MKWLGLPLDASVHGVKIDQLIFLVHILMAALFVGWILFFFYTLFRFSRKRHPQADYVGVRSHASSYLEAVVAIAEVVLLVGLSIPFWAWKVNAFPTDSDAVRVRVVAQQFAWNIHYPGADGIFGRTDIKLVNEQTNPIGLERDADPHAKDDLVQINNLHIPVNRPIIVDLTTKDVIHSFFLPYHRVKQDTIPGMTIPVHFIATQTTEQMRETLAKTITLPTDIDLTGWMTMDDTQDADGNVLVKKGRSVKPDDLKKFAEQGITQLRFGPRNSAEIACAQLCGLGHYRMKGFVIVHDEQGYKDWLQEEAEYLEE